MPTRTINEGFNVLHTRLTPSSHESGKAASHKNSITRRLEQYYGLNQLFYSGSAHNGTSISRHSDVDFFASIPRENLKKNSSISLRQIKECLQDRFKNTNVYVDSPAIVLDFGSGNWDTAEVIPADYIKQIDSKNAYEIPDGSGGWMMSSPANHNAYVTGENVRLKRKLKPLIRFLKAWKYYCNVPISSFYLELRITKLMEEEKSIVYDIDVCSVLRKLNSCRLAAIRDPKGISGLVPACSTETKKTEALSKLSTATKRAENARDAETAGHIRLAFGWWDKVFAGKFPGYYY